MIQHRRRVSAIVNWILVHVTSYADGVVCECVGKGMLALSKAEAQARKDTVSAQALANDLRKENEQLREQLAKVSH